jgi:hypothetical protein
MEQRVLATATFIQQVDQLFDSFNGSRLTPVQGKELKCCVTENSTHMQYWREAYKMMKSWNFRRLTKTGKVRQDKPPSQVGWLVSLKAIQKIWEYLQSKNISSLRPRSLNQDPLENLFGAIRAGCGCNDNPTTSQFVGSLKTQLLNNLTKQSMSGTNCQADDGMLLCNLRSFLSVGVEKELLSKEKQIVIAEVAPLDPATEDVELDAAGDVDDDISNAVALGHTGIFSVAYVSGFIAKRLTQTIDCVTCKGMLCSSPEELYNLFITYKEWSEDHPRLTYPSENLVVAVGKAITLLESILPRLRGQPDVGKKAAEEIKDKLNASVLFCDRHQEVFLPHLIKGVYRVGIPWWCKRKNAEIKLDRKEKITDN